MQDVSNVLKARRLESLTKTFERQLSVRKSPRIDEFLNVSQSARSLKKSRQSYVKKASLVNFLKQMSLDLKRNQTITCL